MKKIAVIGLSGGMDSATLLSLLLKEDYEVHACIFTYGSKHNKYENQAAKDLANHYHDMDDLSLQDTPLKYKVTPHFFNLEEVFKPFESNLLLSGGEIPEGHYEEESMKKTVVPGRNMIFASIMAGLAETVGAEIVALGVHSGDHAIYPDCRAEFIKALDVAIHLSTDKKVEIYAPFSKSDKTGILELGYNLGTPYELTRTCYKNQPLACGKCGSCQERLEAFANIMAIDPIKYE